MSKISSMQYALIFLIIGFFIILLFYNLGNDLVVNRSNFMKSLYKEEYKYVHENMNNIKYENYKIFYKIIDETKPFIFHFCPVLFVERVKKLVDTDANVIQIHYNNTFVKPNIIKKQYLKAFDFCVEHFKIKNIVLLGVCSFTDLCCYVAHKRNDIVDKIILDATMNTHLDTLNHMKFKFIRFLAKDEYTINKKFKITKDILFINYKEETICPIQDALKKFKKLKNDKNNIYLYITKKYPKKEKLHHAEAFFFEDYVDILKKWIYK